MFHRHQLKSFIVSAICIGLLVSCSGKKKKSDGTGDEESGAPDISNIDMTFDPTGSDSGAIQGLVTVNFPYDQAQLDEDSKKKLASNAEWIQSHPNTVVQIEGHCDARGSVEYNLALGERRAKAVKAYLVSMGVKSDKLRVVSYGEEKPMANGESEEAYGKNRRANFVPLPK